MSRIAEEAFDDLLPAHDEPELPELLAACASSESSSVYWSEAKPIFRSPSEARPLPSPVS